METRLGYEIIEKAINDYDFRFFDEKEYDICLYLQDNNYYDDVPMDYNDLTDYLDGLSGEDAFNLGRNSDISFSDDIFVFDGYGNLKSCSSWLSFFRDYIAYESFADWYNEYYELNEEE